MVDLHCLIVEFRLQQLLLLSLSSHVLVMAITHDDEDV